MKVPTSALYVSPSEGAEAAQRQFSARKGMSFECERPPRTQALQSPPDRPLDGMSQHFLGGWRQALPGRSR
jgi:hypothetical protein